MPRFVLLLLSLAFLHGCVTAPALAPNGEIRTPVTILVSIDGFRPDYLERGLTPNLDALGAAGVKGLMRPSFPTKTFPNHYSLVTGFRPDRHGIVDNAMEDPGRPGILFKYSNSEARDSFWWNQAEPIWVTAERAGIRTGTMFWPGSEVEIRGLRPSNWHRFDPNISPGQRVATVVDWLRRPEPTRPRFITLYFETVDDAGHDFGPDSAETHAAVNAIDARIGDLLTELARIGQPANLIILSDHGIAPASPNRVIRIDRMIDRASFRVISEGAFLTLEPQPGREAEVAGALLRDHPHMQCWPQAAIPARFRYGRHPRVASLFCLAETGWTVRGTEPTGAPDLGDHGYDNFDPAMTALFLANGPAFRSGVRLPLFDNIHVYPLLARLIGVAPMPSDAEAAVTEPAVKRQRMQAGFQALPIARESP